MDLPQSSSSRCPKESKYRTPAQQQSDKEASVFPGVGQVLYQIRLYLSESLKIEHKIIFNLDLFVYSKTFKCEANNKIMWCDKGRSILEK